ncbi:flagellar hook-length control protein [Mycobacterium sp. TY813]|uniref:flagellar hook-length control protein n=1 Tax=Mycobacterium TaxID=1763 RepID=UPI002740FBFD|nr:flagellar hook-length control protein [Mycobacterium sp. TY813]MDP7727615.1 flagellar hook-length control protein [Mycobacterium sp. TY813]
MTITTSQDAIKAATSIARDVADGKLSPADLEAQAATELRELFGTVVGEGDVAWPVQLDVARQVLAVGGIPANELAEWLAVERHRAGEPVSTPDPDETTPEPESPVSSTLSADSEHVEAEPVVEVEPPPAAPEPPLRADGYDPLAHWPPSRSLRRPL